MKRIKIGRKVIRYRFGRVGQGWASGIHPTERVEYDRSGHILLLVLCWHRVTIGRMRGNELIVVVVWS